MNVSATDLNSIATGGWFEVSATSAAPLVSDMISVASLGWFESENAVETLPETTEYDEYSAMPNNFFQEENPEYDADSKLYDILLTEAYNINGVPMTFYVVGYDTSKDPIFAEDTNKSIERKFDIMAYYELPEEVETFSSFGIDFTDNFHIYVSMRHFSVASKYNQNGEPNKYPSYIPKVGDLLKAKYNNFYYEIVNVKKEEQQFLKRPHTWDMIVKSMKVEHHNVKAEAKDGIQNITNMDDVLGINGPLNTKKDNVNYDISHTEEPPSDLFGNW